MLSSTPTNNPAEPVVAAKTLAELLSYHDRQFVTCAYQTLLKREPDPEGMSHYLGKLRAGFLKIRILEEITLAQEAKDKAVHLPGLDVAIKRYQKVNHPLLGWLYRILLLDVTEHDDPVERRSRVIEQQIFLISDESNRRFNQLEATLESLRQVILQQTRYVAAEPNEPLPVNPAAANKSMVMPEDSAALKRLSARARDFYHQLKVAQASKMREAE